MGKRNPAIKYIKNLDTCSYSVVVDGIPAGIEVMQDGREWSAFRRYGMAIMVANTRRDMEDAIVMHVRYQRSENVMYKLDTADDLETCWRCDGTGMLGDSECHVCRGMGKM